MKLENAFDLNFESLAFESLGLNFESLAFESLGLNFESLGLGLWCSVLEIVAVAMAARNAVVAIAAGVGSTAAN
jgi:hypothetical protein